MQQIVAETAQRSPQLLSQALVSNGLIFTAGIVHADKDWKLVGETVAEQVDAIMANLQEVLTAAGSDITKVVKVTIYLTDISQLAEFNESYKRYFSADPKPVREAVCVAALPLGASIEMSFVIEK